MPRDERYFYTRDYPDMPDAGPVIFYGDPDNHYQPIDSLDRACELAVCLNDNSGPRILSRFGVSWLPDEGESHES